MIDKYQNKLDRLKKFDKSDRSSFEYWFNHWKAFQFVALSCKAWKFKYLFHDIEKPFLKVLLPYEKVQKIHRKNNKHHPEWLNNKLSKLKGFPSEEDINILIDKYDYEGTIIDWECSRYTKNSALLNAADEYNRLFDSYYKFQEKYPSIAFYCYNKFSQRLMDVIKKLELI